MNIQKTTLNWFLVLLCTSTLVACGGDDDDDGDDGNTMVEATYRITLTNATNNQPLSPFAVILHDDHYSAWDIGASASAGLEDLAESGSPTSFLSESMSMATTQGAGILMPGATEYVDITATHMADMQITVATMLVNTNDAFTGVKNWSIGQLEMGESVRYLAPIYDAGTEENSETAASIPGPAGGGEGMNAAREAHDFVTRHPGVVTQADGYEASALDQSHRFDNGAAVILVERVM